MYPNCGKQNINRNWTFLKTGTGTHVAEIEKQADAFSQIDLPHDWLIFQENDLYESSMGWYKKRFTYRKKEDILVFLCFDGVYMDTTVYVNKVEAGQWKYGYSAFEFEISDNLRDGENEILVSVNYESPNSRWYSGAGIYRDVCMKEVYQTHLKSNGLYVCAKELAENEWRLEMEAEVQIAPGETGDISLEFALVDSETKQLFAVLGNMQPQAGSMLSAVVKGPKRWDINSPDCYEIVATLLRNGAIIGQAQALFGFRTISFAPDTGFSLNGKKVKLNGVCEHHDLGCLGAAYHTDAMRRKLHILKEMGANAIRISHNMAAQDTLELASKLGFLMISEAFDMWERPKTEKDYARFFGDWYQKDVASWIRRDRNYPCVILWSIGNEIYDTHADARGQEVTRLLAEEVRRHDPKKQCEITIASNYMPWENAQKCADIVKVAGYNYSEKYYAAHHKAHPDWVIYGSETASTVQSRGIYHFPFEQSCLSDVDRQCSGLGNATTSWGAKSPEQCIVSERDTAFSCGQFLWSGFDYIGEPTPYHTRSSYLGQIDTAGFPKDSYYIYRSEWMQADARKFVHLFPHWDFNPGQRIDLRATSNAHRVELFVNGESQGSFTIDHAGSTQLCGHWQVPYTPGEVRVLAYDAAGNIVAEDVRKSFGEAVKICLEPERTKIAGAGRELAFVTVTMADRAGNPVENANNRVFVSIGGCGELLGLDNGDSTDTDAYKGETKRLFSGKLLIVAGAQARQGEITITVRAKGLPDATLVILVREEPAQRWDAPIPLGGFSVEKAAGFSETLQADVPVRNVFLTSETGTLLNRQNPETIVHAEICPGDAQDRALLWSVVNDKGIASTLATVSADGLAAKVTAHSDGAFRLRCMSKAGTDQIRLISVLEFQVTGLGTAFTNPYTFVSAGLFDYSISEIGNGNEHGIASMRGGVSGVGFKNIDFGADGSDTLTLPIFALTGNPYRIRIYEGEAEGENEVLLADEVYQKSPKWNVYQEVTWKLRKRLRGVTGIRFLFEDKVHLKGFCFEKQNRAYQRCAAAEYDALYGDSFTVAEDRVEQIGNNVTMEFWQMQFGESGCCGIEICGATSNTTNTIQIRFAQGEAEAVRAADFKYAEKETVQTFRFEPVTGTRDIRFVFLPGSNFNFSWFRFLR